MEQFDKIQTMYDNLKQLGINMNKLFTVSSIIDKLPHTRKDVRSTLLEEIDLTQLATHASSLWSWIPWARKTGRIQLWYLPLIWLEIILTNISSKRTRKGLKIVQRKSTNSTKRPIIGGCWFCRKSGHCKKDCFLYKKKNASKGEATTSQDPVNEGISSQSFKFILIWI